MKYLPIRHYRHGAGKFHLYQRIYNAGHLAKGICFAVLVSFVMIAGCMGSYGKIVSNSETQKQYYTENLTDTYQYYYSGRSGLPNAVVGIDPKYRFQSRMWFPIDTMDQVYQKIRNLSDLHPDANRMRAADILDHEGNLIGVWFSYYYYTPVRVDPETGMVEIFNPYDPNEDERGWLMR